MNELIFALVFSKEFFPYLLTYFDECTDKDFHDKKAILPKSNSTIEQIILAFMI